RRIVDDELAGDEAEQTAAGDDENREALDQPHDELRAADDERHADDEPENEQQQVSPRRGRDAEDVVDAHHEIGDDHRSHGGEQPVAPLHAVTALAALLGNQLDANPHQQRAADDLQIRELQQADGEEREDDAQDDRADRTPEHAPAPLSWRQVAARERDHHRVVARQQDIDDDNFESRKPELRRSDIHAGA